MRHVRPVGSVFTSGLPVAYSYRFHLLPLEPTGILANKSSRLGTVVTRSDVVRLPIDVVVVARFSDPAKDVDRRSAGGERLAVGPVVVAVAHAAGGGVEQLARGA